MAARRAIFAGSPASIFAGMDWLAVGVGGAAGSMARYAAQLWLRNAWGGAFPAGTLLVNLLGSFLVGACAAVTESRWPWLRPWLLAGFLGGFTTFSAFSLENAILLRAGQSASAVLYILLSTGAGLALAFAGYALGRFAGP